MRFQLALNVRNLDEAIAYYGRLFNAPVNKRKPGYANFAVDSPPIKLVLFEKPDAGDRLNHVGFEMDDEEVDEAITRMEPEGLADEIIRHEVCCHAHKKTLYSHDPEGLLWEFYQFLGDADDSASGNCSSVSGECTSVSGECVC